MTRETKVGLLVGTGIILLIGIIVSDHLSVVQRQEPARLTAQAPAAQQEMLPVADPSLPAVAEALPPGNPPVLPTSTRESSSSVPPRGLPELIAMQREQAERAAQAQAQTQPTLVVDAGTQPPQSPVPTNALQQTTPAQQTQQTPQPAMLVIAPPTETLQLTRAVQTAAPPAPTNQKVHFVKAKESLYSIAKLHYGSGEQWRRIKEANPNSVGRNDSVREGVRLIIPDVAATPPATTTLTAERPTDRVEQINTASIATTSNTNIITVAAGDNLSRLAAKHLGSDGQWRKLFEANRDQLSSADDLKVGMKLRLPAPGSSTQASTTNTESRRIESRQTERVAPVAAKPTYTVKPGDTLRKIAARTLGNADRWTEIHQLNRDRVKDADKLEAGVTLRLPPSSQARG